MLDKVFVYGTLRQGQHNAEYFLPGKLHRRATVRGQLHGKDRPFPMLTTGDRTVVGELVEVTRRELGRLDVLEGVDRGLYRRDAVQATVLETGEVEQAWAYFWNDSPDFPSLPGVIESGDWLDEVARQRWLDDRRRADEDPEFADEDD